jgi:hypothetical protein
MPGPQMALPEFDKSQYVAAALSPARHAFKRNIAGVVPNTTCRVRFHRQICTVPTAFLPLRTFHYAPKNLLAV